ncbi:MAG: prolipoprotein diacylglyceryl transferase [Bacteroidota bacterium]
MLLHITWDVSDIALSIGGFEMRWYGLMFAIGFSLGYIMVRRSFLRRQLPESWLDWLFFLLVFFTVVGARLGHVFFYEWDRYSSHPEDIFKVWEGGLASHGGAIGGLLAVWIFSRFVSKAPYLWVCDRLAAAVALTAGLIRMGNLMNSEIVGTPSDAPWAFLFVRAYNGLDAVPRHPVQLYEAISYLLIFIILYQLEQRTTKRVESLSRDTILDAGESTRTASTTSKKANPRLPAGAKQAGQSKFNIRSERVGYQTGIFFLLVFSARFVWEFFKSDQGGGLQEGLGLLSTGQWLSVPLILIGGWLVLRENRSR